MEHGSKENRMAKQHDMGNNEMLTTGIVEDGQGGFLALTLAQSKTFRTRKGAERWLAARGYAPDGSRL